MKLIIAGGRNFNDAFYMEQCLADISLPNEIVCGGATGADSLGEEWAINRKIPVSYFRPNWKEFGRAAGPIRNRSMAEYSDAVALFNGGRGTASMMNEAKKVGIKIYDFRF